MGGIVLSRSYYEQKVYPMLECVSDGIADGGAYNCTLPGTKVGADCGSSSTCDDRQSAACCIFVRDSKKKIHFIAIFVQRRIRRRWVQYSQSIPTIENLCNLCHLCAISHHLTPENQKIKCTSTSSTMKIAIWLNTEAHIPVFTIKIAVLLRLPVRLYFRTAERPTSNKPLDTE